MTTIFITPAIKETLERCQKLLNPCALVTQPQDSYFLVPCFTLEQSPSSQVLKPIDVNIQSVAALFLPKELLNKTYAEEGQEQRTGMDILIHATYIYPNEDDLSSHIPKQGQELDCEECAHRIEDQLSLMQIVQELSEESSSPAEKEQLATFARLIQSCALKALASSRPSSTPPKKPNTSLTPVTSPTHSAPSSRAPSRATSCPPAQESNSNASFRSIAPTGE